MSTLSAASRSAPDEAHPARANPYVGPVPFTAADDEYYFGRDFEARELTALLGAERVVLLHSPSGAGKTSLIQARVIRALERLRFEVLPVARVGRAPVAPAPGSNRYVESALRSLGWSGAPGAPVPELRAHLDGRSAAPGTKGRVLIVDQLEEVFTQNPADLADKREFFRQLGAVLAPPCSEPEEPGAGDGGAPRLIYWALLVIREKYLGALDPYRDFLPARLTTFRINLLDEKKAVAAVQGPARRVKVEVSDAAARGVFLSLCRRQVVAPGGSAPETIQAPFIDPLHLQIACKQIWDDLPPGTSDASAAFASGAMAGGTDRVEQALITYYRTAVAGAAARGQTREATIRLWIDQHLITRYGLRGQFTPDPQNPGLPVESIAVLRESGLLRDEERNGRHWLELAHDRLVRPIRMDNDAWCEKHLAPHQLAAVAWDKAGRPKALLLTGRQLSQAEDWALDCPAEPSALDREFIGASVQERVRRQWAFGVWVVIGVLTATLVGLVASNRVTVAKNKELKKANDRLDLESKTAQVNYLAVKAWGAAESDPELALLYASAAMRLDTAIRPRAHELGVEYRSAARESAAAILSRAGGRALVRHGPAATVEFGDSKNTWSRSVPIGRHTGPVTRVEVTGQWAVTADQDGIVRLWPLDNLVGRQRLDLPPVLAKHTRAVTWTALGPVGSRPRLATVGYDGNLCVWRLDRVTKGAVESTPELFSHVGDALLRAEFFTTDKPAAVWVCAAGRGGNLYFWKLPEGDEPAAHSGPHITATGAHPRGRVQAIVGSSQLVTEAAGGPQLATASDAGDVRLWEINRVVRKYTGKPVSVAADRLSQVAPAAHANGVTDLAFFAAPLDGPPEPWLVSSGNDRAVRVWRLADVLVRDKDFTPEVTARLYRFAGSVVDIAVPERRRAPGPADPVLLAGDAEGETTVFSLPKLLAEFSWEDAQDPRREVEVEGASGAELLRALSHDRTVTDIDITNDGWIVTASADGSVVLRNLSHPADSESHVHLGCGVRSVSFGRRGGANGPLVIVAGGEEGRAKVWSVEEVADLGRGRPLERPADEPILPRCDKLIARQLGPTGVRTHLDELRARGGKDAEDADLLSQFLADHWRVPSP